MVVKAIGEGMELSLTFEDVAEVTCIAATSVPHASSPHRGAPRLKTPDRDGAWPGEPQDLPCMASDGKKLTLTRAAHNLDTAPVWIGTLLDGTGHTVKEGRPPAL